MRRVIFLAEGCGGEGEHLVVSGSCATGMVISRVKAFTGTVAGGSGGDSIGVFLPVGGAIMEHRV